MNYRGACSVSKVALAASLLMLMLMQAATAATLCRLQSGGSVDFGPYDTTTPADTMAIVQVLCERNGGPQQFSVTLGLSAGIHGTSVDNRRMLQVGGSGEFLNYGLFRDAGRSSPWGFTPGLDAVTQTVSVPNKGAVAVTFTIYGRIPAPQNASIGSYGDRIQVTLTP